MLGRITVDVGRCGCAGHGDGQVPLGPDHKPAEGDLDGHRARIVADEQVGAGVGRTVGGPGAADPVRGMPAAAAVLQQGQRAGTQHGERHARPSFLSTKRTQRPGWIAAGGCAVSSHSVASVVPISCHPPGDSRG